MTVKELMEALEGQDPETEVLVCGKPGTVVEVGGGEPVRIAMVDDRPVLTVRDALDCEAIVIVARERSMLMRPVGTELEIIAAEISTTYAKPPAPPLTVASVSAKVIISPGDPA